MTVFDEIKAKAKVESDKLKSANSSFQSKRDFVKKINKIAKDANITISKVSDPQKRDELIKQGQNEWKKIETEHPFLLKGREKITEKFNNIREESVKENTIVVESDLFNGLQEVSGVDERLTFVEDFIVNDSHARIRKHAYKNTIAANDFVFRAVKAALSETNISESNLRLLFNIAELNAMQFIDKYKVSVEHEESDFVTGLFFANLRTAVLIHISL